MEVKLSTWNQYFKGEITRIRSDGTYDVYFPADKTTEKNIKERELKNNRGNDDEVRSSRSGRTSSRKKRAKRKGDSVEVKLPTWNQYFKGEITRIRSDGTYDVYFPADKTTEKKVKEECLKRDEEEEEEEEDEDSTRNSTKKRREGDSVEVKLPTWNQYFKGEITRIRSDGTYDVYFPADKTTEKKVKEECLKREKNEGRSSSSRSSSSSKKRSTGTLKRLRTFYSRAVKKGRARDYRDIFETMDSNRDGAIDTREFYRAMRDIGFDVEREEVNALIDDYDLNNNGRIEWKEFLRLCAVRGDDDDDDDDDKESRQSVVRRGSGHRVDDRGADRGESFRFVVFALFIDLEFGFLVFWFFGFLVFWFFGFLFLLPYL